MRVALRFVSLVASLSVALGLGLPGPGMAQTTNAALRDRVNQLVERLDAPKMEARQAAEDGLIKLGPRILPLLPEPAPKGNAERHRRLERVRAALREASEQTSLDATKVTL